MILRKETETLHIFLHLTSLQPPKIRMNDTPQGDGN